MRPITIADGMIDFTMSKTMLLTQYAVKLIPLTSCMCFKLFSFSFTMKETTDAGIIANPIATTNTIKNPLALFALYLNISVIGKG
jgi:hypothetical protein